ncbi:MAG: hypothetical protein AAGF86_11365 [Pseudomonadota bacterium]
MVIFEDIQDLEDWLAPLDYIAFWREIAGHALFTEDDRDHCDALIMAGEAPQDAVLVGLKTMARLKLAQRYGLSDRIYAPIHGPYLASAH